MAAPGRRPKHRVRTLAPGLGLIVVGTALAWTAHAAAPAVGTLTWAVALGIVAANLGLVPAAATPGVKAVTKRLLRTGVVLLGLSLSFSSVFSLGWPVVLLIAATVVSTLAATTWLGLRLGLGRPRSLLIGTGFAICGASAVAAMQDNAEADEEDVAAAIAMVTLCGTFAMVALPLLQQPLGLGERSFGTWVGASVHEVGQVVGAAGPAGAAAVAIAVVVKLTRVLMLAPVVAVVGLLRRREARRAGAEGSATALPPLIPLFVLGFVACVAVRSSGRVPADALDVVSVVETCALAAALFGMGTSVRLRALVSGAGPALRLSAASTVVVAAVSLVGVIALG